MFGFAVAAAVYGLVVIQLGKTVVVINITDPDITVSIAEQGNKIEILTGPRESKIEVQPGEQELKIKYAGLEARTQKFELKKGQRRRVTVSIVNKELVATLDQQSLSLIEPSEKATSGDSNPAENRLGDACGNRPKERDKTSSTAGDAHSTGAPVAAHSAATFVPLFNGRDLAGWKTDPSQPGNWHVENGVLIGSGAEVSHLYTERDDYADFHLRVEARINEKGNSGIDFRTTFGPKWPADSPKFPYGYEAQIDSGNHPAKTGSLFVIKGGNKSGTAVVAIRDTLVPPGDWFTLEVIARGKHLEIKVNGGTVATRDDSHFDKGHIALQQLEPQTVVEFRKIEIQELASAAHVEAPAEHVTPTPGFVPLFNGGDLTGWQTRPGESPDWSVKNGILSGGVPDGTSFLYSRARQLQELSFANRGPPERQGEHRTLDPRKMPDPSVKSPVPEIGYKVEMKEPPDGNRTGSIWAVGRKEGKITLNGYGRNDHNVRPGEWFTLEVIATGKQTVVLVNGKGPTNLHWNQRDSYQNGAYIAFEQSPNQPPAEIRRVEIQEFDASSDASSQAQSSTWDNILVNGSFEDGPSPGNFKPYNPGSTAIPAWKVTRGQIDLQTDGSL